MKYWTPEDDNIVLKHYHKDKTAKQIGAMLNRSNNSVISRAKVLGLLKSKEEAKEAEEKRKASIAEQKKLAEKFHTRQEFKAHANKVDNLPDFPCLNIPLVERSNSQCAEIVQKGRCCGNPTWKGTSWCQGHAAINFKVKTIKEIEAREQ